MAHRVPARLSAAEGRAFAFTVGGAFVALAGVAWWRGRPTLSIVLAALGLLLGAAGGLVPARLGPLNQAWMGLAHAISRVTTPVFMGIIFFVVITPIGVLLRLFGSSSLRPAAGAATLWHRRDASAAGSDLTRQF